MRLPRLLSALVPSDPRRAEEGAQRLEDGAHAAPAQAGLALAWKLTLVVVGFFWLLDAFARYGPLVAQGFPYDFIIDQRLARGLVEGFNAYTPEGNHRAEVDRWLTGIGHPPTTPFWAMPFVPLEPHVANTAVAWFSLCLLLLQIATTSREQRWWAPLAHGWFVFAAIVNTDFFLMQIGLGQFSVAIGFCYFLAWLFARRGQDVSAGIPLGIACTIKVFPAFVVLYFLVVRRWRVVAAACAVYAGVFVFTSCRFGWSSWHYFLERQPKIMNEWLGRIQNQSLFGITEHLFHPTCGPRVPVSQAGLRLGMAVVALLTLAFVLLARRTLARDPRSDLPLGAFVVLSLFCSQWTWEHYDVMLLLPFSLAVHHLVGQLGLAKRASGVRGARDRARVVLPLLGGLALLFAFAVILRLPIGTKDVYQNRVWRGDMTAHLGLHVHEILNWLPLAGTLGLFAWLLARPGIGIDGGARASSAHAEDIERRVPGELQRSGL